MIFLKFLVAFNSFFTIPLKTENARLKLALTIPIGAPITFANDEMEIPLVVTDKTINDLSKKSKEPMYMLSLLLINSFSSFSAIK